MCKNTFVILLVAFGAVTMMLHVQAMPQQQPEASSESPATTEPSTWDKIKQGVEHGWQVVYDESHCALHKVKELVQDHKHENGTDPCVNKPYKQKDATTEKSIVLEAEDILTAGKS